MTARNILQAGRIGWSCHRSAIFYGLVGILFAGFGLIGRILKIDPQSVANWVTVYTAKLSAAPVPDQPKENEVYLLTVVDRATHCVLSWEVVAERTSEALQACLERVPPAVLQSVRCIVSEYQTGCPH